MRSKSTFLAVGAIGALLAARAWCGEGGPAVKPGGGTERTILDTKSGWRVFAVRGPGVIPLDLLKAAEPAATGPKPFLGGGDIETPPPPPDWMKPDFDDSVWPRSAGPFPGGDRGHALVWNLNWRRLLCLRGRFYVAAPGSVKKLALTMRYTGGAVVYLNGREVLRLNMPAGKIGFDAPAEPYPLEAYVDSKGKILPFQHLIEQRIREQGEKDLAERVALRGARKVEAAAIPVEFLRKGVNVLAVEIHQAAYRPEALQWYPRDSYSYCWPHIGLDDVRLAADAAPGAIERAAGPAGSLQIYVHDLHRLPDADLYADPCEPACSLRLTCAANGICSGMVVVCSIGPIKGLKAAARDLKGPATIPSSAIRVRFLRPCPPAYPGLEDAAPGNVEPSQATKVATQAVCVTLRVPPGAPAGRYSGAVEISAAGTAPTAVPIELDVAGWKLPDPTEFRTFGAFYQSPDALALHYGVPMWSDRHWELVEKSAELLGYIGNNFACVPLVCRTEFGNDESMVVWKSKSDGSWEYDFSVMERYLDILRRHSRLKIVSAQVYFGGGWGAADPAKRPVSVTAVDPSGKRSIFTLPNHGTEEAKKLWKPLVDRLRERLRKRGLEGALVFGIGHCGGINKDVIAFFKDIAPGVGWHIAKHNRARPNEFPTHRYVEWMYIPPSPVPMIEPRYPNDGKGLISIMMQRIYDEGQPPFSVRTAPERSYLLGDSGVGRICLDYWPVKSPDSGKMHEIYDRWPSAMASQRKPCLMRLASPGSNGPVSTPKVEALREGFQETEARLFIEGALAANRIGGGLAERCRRHLAARVAFCRITHSGADDIVCATWRPELTADVYRLAAEVAAAAGR